MQLSQEKSFKVINKYNKKYSKNLGFSFEDFENDVAWEYAQLSCKDKIIERTASLKKKMSIKKILYPSIVILLLSITSAGVYGGIKMSSKSVSAIVTSNHDYESLFQAATTNGLVKKSIESIDKVEMLKQMTNWADNYREQLCFDEAAVKRNIINLVEPAITKLVGNDNYINIKYNIIDGTTLNADVRWSKVKDGKLVNDVYYDWLQITLNDYNKS